MTETNTKTETENISTPPVKKDTWWDLLKFAFIVAIIVIPFRLFIAQPFIVQGASMDPTFKSYDYLIVDELSYELRSPKRGEVVVFAYPLQPQTYFIKRIIGLPGETVKVVGNQVTIITKDGKTLLLKEPYIGSKSTNDVTTTLKAGQYFVMGDNRAVSWDSRYWGPVDQKYLKGRAFLRLFPFDEIGYLPGNYTFSNSN